MATPFKIQIDQPQSRVVEDRLYSLISGKYAEDEFTGRAVEGWSEIGSLDARDELTLWQEPVTGKLLLRPLQITRLWQETSTGNYARLLKASLTLVTSANWEDSNFNNEAAASVRLLDSTGTDYARTTATYTINRPFFVNPLFFSPNSSDGRPCIEVSYGDFDAAGSVGLKLFANGHAEVYKSGVCVGKYNWSGEQGKASIKANGQRIGFVILPCPPTELIVVSTLGGGFTHSFKDLDPLESTNTITPASSFYFRCHDMGTDVELAPCTFASSGWIHSVPTEFIKIPPSASPEMEAFYSFPGYGTQGYDLALANHDGDGAFDPGDGSKWARIEITLTSDNISTPFIWGADAEFPADQGETPDETLDITEYIVDTVRLSAALAPGSTRMEFAIGRPATLNPNSTLHLYSVENRPVCLDLGDIRIIDGINDKPSYDDASWDDPRRIHWVVRDMWKLLEDYRFTDVTPFDGLTLGDLFVTVLLTVGFKSDQYDLDPELYSEECRISLSSRASCGDWAIAARPQQTAADFLIDVHEQYIADWFMAIVPTVDGPILKVQSPSSMTEEPVFRLYEDFELARDDEEIEDEDARLHVHYTYGESSPPIETNELYVAGTDPATGRPMIQPFINEDSQDPTLTVAARDPRWTGTRRKAAVSAAGLRSRDALERAGEKLWKRASYRRLIGEWTCEMMINPETEIPVWVGEVVELVGKGMYRIQALDVDLRSEPSEGIHEICYRKARYIGERLQDQEDARGLGRTQQRGRSILELVMGWARVRKVDERGRRVLERPRADVQE